MRLYVTKLGKWAGTQAEANALAKEEGTGWEQRDVPTDKDGLLGFLNAYSVDAMHGEAKAMVPDPVPTPAAPAGDPVRAAQKHAINVEEEIGKADLPNAIRLFDHISWRINELLKPARGA